MTAVIGEDSAASSLRASNHCGIREAEREIVISADQLPDTLKVAGTAIE